MHGNGITLSNRLWQSGVRDLPALTEFVRSRRSPAPLTFGIPFSCSSHNFLLQKWLRGGGLEPVRDVNLVVVPPPQMAANLKAGTLDGYCVGEPWNSLAVVQRAGWVAALSPNIAPRHPEKVLLARADFAESRAEEHELLIGALLEACEFCHQAENREQVARTLAGSSYLNIKKEAIERSLVGPFRFRKDQTALSPDTHVFAGPGVNEPDLEKAVWARDSLRETGMLPDAPRLNQERLGRMFRADLFDAAVMVQSH
jgi:ABC-type nitrate/sulfonate/bicarbonate transport system substrate-binding protein